MQWVEKKISMKSSKKNKIHRRINWFVNKKVSYRKQMAVDPVKTFYLYRSVLITMQNVVVVSQTVCAQVGGPKICGPWGSSPLDRGVADP